ncbi:MAG: peptide-binding protein [Elusimicrobiota bacterium]|nr:peptide-binding protein [Elusimicrobiota bacterium]
MATERRKLSKINCQQPHHKKRGGDEWRLCRNNFAGLRLAILVLIIANLAIQNSAYTKHTELKEGAKPDRGDIYVDSSIGDASYLNPVLASDSASGNINGLVYNGLVKYDKNIKLVGDLAESWEISPDGLTIIFKLREGVKWHDGQPFTAEDVRFTYEKLIDPKVKTPYSADYLLVKKFEILDKYTIRITYKKPFAPALESWGMGIIPKHIFESTSTLHTDFNSHPANRSPTGTGYYKFVEWMTDEKIVLNANLNYFEGSPFINRYIYRIIPDQSVQFLELRKQTIDSMNLTPDQYFAYKEFFRHYNKFRYPAFAYTYLGFNLRNELFKEKTVRKAITYAINKQEIIQGVLLGLGSPATGPFPPASWAYNTEVKDYEYNPEKSKQLFNDLGWSDTDNDGYLDKNGKKFEFTIMTNQGNKARALCAEIIQQHLKKVGIKVNIRVVEWSAFIHNFIKNRAYDAVILGWALSRDPDQYAIWHSEQTKEGQYNFVSYSNKEVDRLLEAGRTTFDYEKRKNIYHKIHKILHDDVPYVFLYYPDALPVVHKRFIGPEVAPLGLGWNFREWYVPKNQQRYSFAP